MLGLFCSQHYFNYCGSAEVSDRGGDSMCGTLLAALASGCGQAGAAEDDLWRLLDKPHCTLQSVKIDFIKEMWGLFFLYGILEN